MVLFTISVVLTVFSVIASVNLSVVEEFQKWPSEDQNCSTLLENFANSSAHFTYCAIKNARPIRICSECFQKFQEVVDVHNNISKMEDESGIKICKQQLMNLDRLEVIEKGFLYITDMWDSAHCKNCLSIGNRTEVSNTTMHFMQLRDITKECFKNHSSGGETYDQSVCVDCEKVYCDMNKFYDSLKTTQGDVCMDIVDSMNITRVEWNVKLKCKQETRALDLIYVGCSCFFGALPVIFYLGAKLFTTVIRNRLQMQKRLAEVLRPSTSGEINQ